MKHLILSFLCLFSYTTIVGQILDAGFLIQMNEVVDTSFEDHYHQITGIVQISTGEGIEDATISFIGEEIVSAKTGSEGNYESVLLKGNYDIIPSKEDDPMNGVTTFDQVLIQRHLLDIKPFNTIYQYVAADINLSGSISTFDIVLLRRMILGKDLYFTAQESWIFIPTNYSIPERYTIDFLGSQTMNTSLTRDSNFDFVGVKRGDIDESALINSNFRPTTSRNKELLELTTTDILPIGLSYQAAVNESEDLTASIQPNLLTSSMTQLVIEGLPATTLFIRILNAQGQLIQASQNQTTSNYYQQTLYLPDVSGIYWVQLRTTGELLQTFKIIKI